MNVPNDRLYTSEHEWVKIDGRTATIGITDYAQNELGDLVYVQLPEPGAKAEQSKPIAVVESVKTASDVYAPVSGTIAEVNGLLVDEPQKINADPYGEGWLIKIEIANPDDSKSLLDAAAYEEVVTAAER